MIQFYRHLLARTVHMVVILVTIHLIASLVIPHLNTITKMITVIIATKFQNISIPLHKSVRSVQKVASIVILCLTVLSVIGTMSIR